MPAWTTTRREQATRPVRKTVPALATNLRNREGRKMETEQQKPLPVPKDLISGRPPREMYLKRRP